MKKVFIYLSIVLMGVLICSQNVYADDVTGEPTMDDVGHVIKGRVCYQDNLGTYYDYDFSNDSGIYLVQISDVSYCICSLDTQNILSDGYFYVDPDNITDLGASYMTHGAHLHTLMAGSFISTNIPIIKNMDDEAFQKYAQYGDKSGALNSTDFRDSYDESIPLPHNLKVVSGVKQITDVNNLESGLQYPLNFSKDVIINWEQDDVIDNLKYDIEVCFYYLKVGSDDGSVSLEQYNTAYYPIQQNVSYNNAKDVTCTMSASSLNSYYGVTTGKLLSKMNIRVRNKANGLSSNCVSVTIDFHKQTASGSEEAYENDSDVKNEYDNSDVNADASTNGGSGGSDVSLSGVMSFIRDGFGLLGNGGIIALLSSTFVYLPNSIWIMLKFLVAMMIAVCIIKLVKDVVT